MVSTETPSSREASVTLSDPRSRADDRILCWRSRAAARVVATGLVLSEDTSSMSPLRRSPVEHVLARVGVPLPHGCVAVCFQDLQGAAGPVRRMAAAAQHPRRL